MNVLFFIIKMVFVFFAVHFINTEFVQTDNIFVLIALAGVSYLLFRVAIIALLFPFVLLLQLWVGICLLSSKVMDKNHE